jgi:energy-coupling factor transporter ATP-binding protein EcfA2
MIQGARQVPMRHVTIRVPWHDNGWKGNVCQRPSANTYCTALKRIAAVKSSFEDNIADRGFDDLAEADLPPCIDERGAFMAKHDLVLTKNHPYAKTTPETHGHFGPTPLRLFARSAACVPFGWMLRKGAEGKAEELQLGFEQAAEASADEAMKFDTSWVQAYENQAIMLDTFFSAIKAEDSLCFFYAKKTPLSDDPRRVIVGVGRVKEVGPPTQYERARPGPQNLLWERCVRHSIREDGADGFLLPYGALLARAAANPELPLEACIAFAPADQFDAFSYGSEHLSHDGAIASLLACAAALRSMRGDVEEDLSGHIQWIDRELARLWKARGAFPGFGAALCAFGIQYGTLLAQQIELKASSTENPFRLLDAVVEDPSRLPGCDGLGFGPSFRQKWKRLPADRRALLELLARMELLPEQALSFYDADKRASFGYDVSDADILANPFILIEQDADLSFDLVDRGLFPEKLIKGASPIPAPSVMADTLDPRRVRAAVYDTLRTAATSEGHTLLPQAWLVTRIRDRELAPPCPIDADTMAILPDEVAGAFLRTQDQSGSPSWQLSQYDNARRIIARVVIDRVEKGRRHVLNYDWRRLIDETIHEEMPRDSEERHQEERARKEKAASLAEMAQARFSLLLGPAGSGKTTLLRCLCDLKEVRTGGILLLAPTGKARVRLEDATGRRGEGRTLAQFLSGLGRYANGVYSWTEQPPRENAARTVIVDEASMLTEDQLAALFDSLEGVERIVLVGDHRQLSPIGAGRPLVDIQRRLAPAGVQSLFPRVGRGYAELTMVRRQQGRARGDLLLARQFSGDGADAASEEVWSLLRDNQLSGVRLVRWGSPRALHRALFEELKRVLNLAADDDEQGFERTLGGTPYNDVIFFWAGRNGNPGAAAAVENWQILSPVRGGLFGVDELNRAVQARYRKRAREWSLKQKRQRKIPPPQGTQGLLWGDKVINIVNNGRRKTYPDIDAPFVANGDIGIIVGTYKTKNHRKPPSVLEVEFSAQTGVVFKYWPSEFTQEDKSPELELAYALTVHKTQGSQFGHTLVVIPEHCRPLSRELLYTALTRHRGSVTILLEGALEGLARYGDDTRSEIARRMTNLFESPAPVEVLSRAQGIGGAAPGEARTTFLEDGLVHRTSRGEFVRSKSELALAEKFIAQGLTYIYERPVNLAGSTRYPDFTFANSDTGRTVYWEHLGLMQDPDYRRRWEHKKSLYRRHGVLPLEEGEGENGVLVTTEEQEGVGLDMAQVNALIDKAGL